MVESTSSSSRTHRESRRRGRSRAKRRRLPRAVEQASYRILQEALANVRFHSRAELAGVRAHRRRRLDPRRRGRRRRLRSRDARREPGMGLQGMIERASALGASFTIESAPGEGTRVAASRFRRCATPRAASGLHDELESASAGETRGTLRVFVAERHSLVRAGLIRILEAAGDIRVVGEARSARGGSRPGGPLQPRRDPPRRATRGRVLAEADPGAEGGIAELRDPDHGP